MKETLPNIVSCTLQSAHETLLSEKLFLNFAVKQRIFAIFETFHFGNIHKTNEKNKH